MNREEYNILFHKVGLNRVAFKAVNDCDEEILALVNEAVAAERERILDMCKEGLWDGEGIRFHLEKQGKNND
jgi:hypothetical protein